MEQKSEIVLYQPEGSVSLEVRLENETVWLTQQQISELFGTGRQAITKHLKNIIRKTKCSSVLKQNVLFYKTKRTSVNLFSYPNWHKKAPKKYVFFGAFYCSVFWLSHQKSLTLNKYIIFGFNAILIPLKRRYIIPPESWARHRLYSIMSVYVAL